MQLDHQVAEAAEFALRRTKFVVVVIKGCSVVFDVGVDYPLQVVEEVA